jgi:hypothetical protein
MPKFTIELIDSKVSVPTGKSGHIVTVDLERIAPNVLAELLRQGCIKPLTDISQSADETEVQWHERRLKRVENWYAGDFTVRGGGTADPVAVQMKEEIVRTLRDKGVDRKVVAEKTKGTASQILERFYPDEAKREAAVAHFRKLAEGTLAERKKAAAKVSIDDIDLLG